MFKPLCRKTRLARVEGKQRRSSRGGDEELCKGPNQISASGLSDLLSWGVDGCEAPAKFPERRERLVWSRINR